MTYIKYFIFLFLAFEGIFSTREEEQKLEQAIDEDFNRTVSNLFEIFEEKKVVKGKEVLVHHREAASRNKYLSETLTEDMSSLRNNEEIKNPKDGKLYAILENIEAIEINLKMAAHYEVRANRLCSVYFDNYSELRAQSGMDQLDDASLLSQTIDNFSHFNFAKIDDSGLFLTRELSRHGDFDEDLREAQSVVNQLVYVLRDNYDKQLLKEGSFGKILSLPDDALDEAPKRVLKAMAFGDNFITNLQSQIAENSPILDMILFVVKHKRDYFEKVVKEVKLYAKLNQFKVISSTERPNNDPEQNIDAVNFFGCLNIRWSVNQKAGPSANVIQLLKDSYSARISEAENTRDLTFADLQAILGGFQVDLSTQTQASGKWSLEEQFEVVRRFLKAMGVYDNYLFVSVFERMDIDLFDDIFQKIYFLNISSFEERLEMYINFANKLQALKDLGYSHCDLKMNNILYKIVPEHNFYSFNEFNIRLIDFAKVQHKTRFCRGGTIGYLAPEVENSLRLPHDESEFLAMLARCPDTFDVSFEKLDLEDYGRLQESLVAHFSVSIPEDYTDLRSFFADASIVKPESIGDWLRLLNLLSPVFIQLDLIPKINYSPSPEEIDVPSNKLKVVSEKKVVIKFDPSSQMDMQKLTLKFNQILKTVPAPTAKAESTLNSAKNTQAPKIRIEIRGLNLSTRADSPRQKYMRRFRARRSMFEGSLDYPSKLIAPLNKADIFSLGILFTEIETAINSNSIFESFSQIEKGDFGQLAVQNTLHDAIKKTFSMKMTRASITSQIKSDVKSFFKTEHDMHISFKQYSSEYRAIQGAKMKEFPLIMEDLQNLLVGMTSYYAHDRPDIEQVNQKLADLKQRLAAIKASNRVYSNSINVINRKIRATEASILKQKYKSIYQQNTKFRLLV